MPRALRIALTAWAFLLFFLGSPLIGLVVLPAARLFAPSADAHLRRCTRWIAGAHRVFWGWLSLSGLVHRRPDPVALPGLGAEQPYVMVTNHPSLIDVILLLGSYDGLTCVVKGSWYRSIVLGPLLRQTTYLAGPGSGLDESEDMLGTMVEHLRAGHRLLVFPEGTRSLPGRLHRFRRGAAEAAVRAGVPIVALFIEVDPPVLRKGVPFWKVPSRAARFRVELLDILSTEGVAEGDARRLNAALQARFQERFAAAAGAPMEAAARSAAAAS